MWHIRPVRLYLAHAENEVLDLVLFLVFLFVLFCFLLIYLSFFFLIFGHFGSSLLHARAFSSCSERGLLFVAVRGLLVVVASLGEHRLQASGLQ